MNDRTPADAPLEHFTRHKPMTSKYELGRWNMATEVITGSTLAELVYRAKEYVSQQTGVPAAQLEVVNGFTIYPVEHLPSHQLSDNGIKARDAAGDDTLWSHAMRVYEPVRPTPWQQLRKRVRTNFEQAREDHRTSLTSADGRAENITAYAMADALRWTLDQMEELDES